MKLKFSKKIFTAVLFLLIFAAGIAAGGFGLPLVKAKVFPGSETKLTQQNKPNHEVGPIHDLKEFIVNLKGGGIVKTEKFH
jgi:hypothetical protein